MGGPGKVAVLMGGSSAERAISLETGSAVLTALRARGIEAEALDLDRDLLPILARGGYTRVFIALHGRG
ncbi:MAG: D-alanine--D-alanine ligase, partial [Gammaproteobacteria bacterium]